MSLVIGRGEVGSALSEVIDCPSYDITDDALPGDEVDVLHIAIPFSDDFIKEVKRYMKIYQPELTIVYSSVPIGTCEAIGEDVVHSPIEGKHPLLAESILLHTRWLGCKNKDSLYKAAEFWMGLVKGVETVESSQFTEFLKLRSTSKYGINLVWTDYEADVAKFLGMKFNLIKKFDQDYNALYRDLKMPQYQRYILKPPHGEIGGHCVVPNAELLAKDYPHPLLDMIGEKNGR